MNKKSLSSIINWISGDIAIDLGTANTLIWLKGKGVVINEPSIVARTIHDDNIVAVGDEAKAMLGRTHRDLETIRPLQDGVIADFKMTDGMDESILQWFRNEHKLEIGLGMSESIKKSVGSAMQMSTKTISVRGQDLVTGIPKTIEVSSDEIRQALKDPVNAIVEAVKRCLEQTPPELAADILERGIIVAGGGSLLRGIDQIIRERTNVPVNVAEDPLLSVVRGTGMVLENLKKYEAVLL